MSDLEDSAMRGFLFLKAAVSRWGPEKAATLIAAADEVINVLKERGVASPPRRQVINDIEKEMGYEPTIPMSEEGASHHVESADPHPPPGLD